MTTQWGGSVLPVPFRVGLTGDETRGRFHPHVLQVTFSQVLPCDVRGGRLVAGTHRVGASAQDRVIELAWFGPSNRNLIELINRGRPLDVRDFSPQAFGAGVGGGFGNEDLDLKAGTELIAQFEIDRAVVAPDYVNLVLTLFALATGEIGGQ